MSTLPFPGYSWFFTQHAVGLEPKTLYGLLACAALAQGQLDPGTVINESLVENHILTDNIRDGEIDAWRDYQQILAEVGLIYSTKVQPRLKLTLAGEMFLAGDVGFSELMTIQALRYQYPNGQKSTIQSRVRSELASAGIATPRTVIELMLQEGVMVKPGLLILRILLELFGKTGDAFLTLEECGNFLVPLKTNQFWPKAFYEITTARSNTTVTFRNPNIRRNLQDWFKFLGKTDIFFVSGNVIRLTEYAKNISSQLLELCTEGEDPSTFWFPRSFDPVDKISWFSFFGELPFDFQLMMPIEELTEDYKEINYVGGFEEDPDEQYINFNADMPQVAFSEFKTEVEDEAGIKKLSKVFAMDEDALKRFRNGILQRKAKTSLHDSIVRELASKFKAQGASVYEDRDSFDLLAQWPKDVEGIFEVKTVTKRSLQQRMRLAIGQLEEYSYRRGSHPKQDKIIVLNTDIPDHAWQIDFLTKKLNIGLLCKCGDSYKAFAPDGSFSGNNWSNL